MRKFLLDTGIMGDFIDRRSGVDVQVREARKRGDRVGTCMAVVGELYAGIEGSASKERNLPRLRAALTKVVFWPFERRSAEEYGRIAAELRRIGRPMQAIDIQIAAIALSLGNCTVVTKDSNLSAISGLDVADWASG